MARNQITGRSAFLALLKDEGVTHLFAERHSLQRHTGLQTIADRVRDRSVTGYSPAH